MTIDRRTSTPTEPTIIDSLLDPRDVTWSEDGSVVSECADGHSIMGQELPLYAGVLNEEQPE